MKKLSLFFFAAIACINAQAQKLPNVQQASVQAPANVKIDGKANEWNKFEAYNKTTDIFYTIANDRSNLYVVIQATDKYIVRKMLLGQTVFTVSKSKQFDGTNITVSYPVIDRKDRPDIKYEKPDGRSPNAAATDSLIKINNKHLAEKAKLIKVTGVKQLDTLVSVYNTNGLQAAGAFNNKLFYTYEMAIDLKLLGIDPNDTSSFYYNIKLHQLSAEDTPGVKITYDGNGNVIGVNIREATSFSPSYSLGVDFWGEYTLAK